MLLETERNSFNRDPNGINGESFYFKDLTGTTPGWIETYEYKSEANYGVINYLAA